MDSTTATHRLRILAVEDDPEALSLYRKVFPKTGSSPSTTPGESPGQVSSGGDRIQSVFDVSFAKSAQEAERLVRESLETDLPFSVAFIEVEPLSGEDGIEIAEVVRSVDPYVNIVLMGTGEDVDSLDILWRIPPADKILYMLKPLSREELIHFSSALGAKWNVERQLRSICSQLQTRVEERTSELTVLNEQLQVKIEEHKVIEEALRNSEHFLENVLDAIQDGILVLDLDYRVIRSNRAVRTWLGEKAFIPEQRCYEMFYGRTHQCINCPAIEALKKKSLHMEIFSSHDTEGNKVWQEIYIFPIFDSNGETVGLVEYIRDITEKVRVEEQLLHSSFHDKLTGLPNRVLLLDRVDQALRRLMRNSEYLFATMIVDLDRFKVLNDSLGHSVGDKLLVSISQRLQSCVRNGDTVARLGGDEFGVLLDGIKHVSDATRVAERIQQELNKPFALEDQEVFTSASIGIALSAVNYKKAEDLLRSADTAMFRAKALGKSRHEIFDSAMHSVALKQLQLETSLRRAIEREEFLLHYQPIISLRKGHIVGFEALVRWENSEKGLVSPADFIPIAEETGLIVPIGEWVLEQSCVQLKQWQEKYIMDPPLYMSVNISGRQFNEENLWDRVNEVVSSQKLDPSTLRLEITESEIMENAQSSIEKLNLLKKLGLQLYIDDFGTGYSSLSYLHRFPLDALKIDRSFVIRLGTDNESLGIVRTIAMLARDLSLSVVVEGIETAEQLETIRTLGCEFGQGYFFSKPLAKNMIEELLESKPVW